MSVYKTPKSPYWQYDFQYKGLRFHGSTGQKTRRKAEQVERHEREKAALRGKKREPMPLGEAAARYFSEIAEHQPSAQWTFELLESLIAALGAKALLSEIDDDRLAEAVAKLRGQRSRSGGVLSNGSVNRRTERLRAIFRRAHRVWKRDIGEMPDWQAHLLPEADERKRHLNDETREALLAAIAQRRPDYEPMFRFAFLTGMRLGNIIRLTWSQVDFATRRITVKVKSKKPGGREVRIPVTRPMLALLAEQKGQHPIYVFTYVCSKPRGRRRRGERYPFSKGGWRKVWAKALKDVGLGDFRFHDIRHDSATRTLRVSGNLKIVQKQLGHADIASTMRYAHVLDEDVMQAMEEAHSQSKSSSRPDAVTVTSEKEVQ